MKKEIIVLMTIALMSVLVLSGCNKELPTAQLGDLSNYSCSELIDIIAEKSEDKELVKDVEELLIDNECINTIKKTPHRDEKMYCNCSFGKSTTCYCSGVGKGDLMLDFAKGDKFIVYSNSTTTLLVEENYMVNCDIIDGEIKREVNFDIVSLVEDINNRANENLVYECEVI